MSDRIHLVVNRTEDHVVVLIPDYEQGRAHAIVSEEEAYLCSTTIRRMVAARDERVITVGMMKVGMRVERVNHATLPIEVRMTDSDGETVIDLTKDDTLTLADMLWGAHRATGSFYAMTTLSGSVRWTTTRHAKVQMPQPDGLEGLHARIVGNVRRRIRQEDPESKR